MHVTARDLPALERGVAVLGSGGGGDTVTAAALLRRVVSGDTAEVRDAADLADDNSVLPVGVVGATQAFGEKLPSGSEFVAAAAAIERWAGRRAHALMSIEVGGLNGLVPLAAAHEMGRPYVDADLAGRGLPRLDQLSVAAAGRGLAPIALAEPGGGLMLLTAGSDELVERAARAFVATCGGWAAMALTPVPARELPECTVLGTVTTALVLGSRLLTLGENASPTELADASGGTVLASGRVVEVARHATTAPGYGRGSVTLLGHPSGPLFRLETENEYLLALRDGVPVASTPDVITVLDHRNGVPVSCDEIRPGMEVNVLHLPAPLFWTDPRRIATVSPRAFGIDCNPVTSR